MPLPHGVTGEESVDDEQDPGEPRQPAGPTPRQMARYTVEGLILVLLLAPAFYLRSIKKSPHAWFSAESFNDFGTYLLWAAVVIVLIRIGSHADQ